MNDNVASEIRRFVAEDGGNRFQNGSGPYFEEPLVGFAAAGDPLFTAYKTLIGDFHLTPEEMAAASSPDDTWRPATVICWVLPISASTRASNRHETLFPSQEWAWTRNFGEQFNSALRKHLVSWLEVSGYHATAPQLSPVWRELPDSPAGVASTWSERHAAYAAGLGTFSLNDALITPKGIAHRIGSVITDLRLEPSPRPYDDYRSNCLFYRKNTCGACIDRCPAGALSHTGHDKVRCRAYVYGTIPEAVGIRYGVSATGCGLCQTRVPCEQSIPK